MKQLFWNSLAVCYKDKAQLLYDPATPILAIYPREMKTYNHTKTYTGMLEEFHIHNRQKLETAQISIQRREKEICFTSSSSFFFF